MPSRGRIVIRPYNTGSTLTVKIVGKAFMPSAKKSQGMDKSIPYDYAILRLCVVGNGLARSACIFFRCVPKVAAPPRRPVKTCVCMT